MLGGGCWAPFRSGPISVGGCRGSKGLLPCFLVPKGNQPTACTLALWWLKFGPTEQVEGGGGHTLRRLWYPLPHWWSGVFIITVIHGCFLLFLLIWTLQSPTSRNSLL